MLFESNLTEFDRPSVQERRGSVARSVEVAPAGMPRTEVADVQIGVSDQSVGYAGPQTVDEDDFEVVNARRSKASPLSCTLSVRSCVGLRCNGSGGSERHTPSPYCRVIVEQDEGDRSAQQTLACWQEADPTWDEEFELQDLSLGAVVRLEVWGQSSDGDEFLGEATVSRETLWQHQDALEAGGFEQELSLQTNLTKHIEAASGVLRVSWQTKGKARIWTRPSHSKALAHRSRSRPWDTSTEMPHKPRPLTSSFLMEGQLGEGIALWMRFQRNMWLLFSFIFALNVPAFVLYAHGKGLASASGKPVQGNSLLAIPSLGNLFEQSQIEANLDASRSQAAYTFRVFGHDVEISLVLVSVLLPSLDLLGLLVFLGFIARLHFSQQAQTRAIDKKTKTLGDFSVMVTNVYGKNLDKDAVREYFEQFGTVEAVSFATYTEVFLTCKRKSADINDIIGIVEAKVGKAQQRAKDKGSVAPVFWIRDPEQGHGADSKGLLTSRKSSYMPLVRSLENSRKALDALTKDLEKLGAQCDDVYAAFVTFAQENERQKCLDSVGWRDALKCVGGKDLQSVAISQAPEASNVYWEHLPYGRMNRRLRNCAINFLALLLLGASFFSILMAQIYQRNNPLPSCPPRLLESAKDVEAQAYFTNTATDVWGPGTRGVGLSGLVSDTASFDQLGVCEGGGSAGRACATDDDCSGITGFGTCRVYDLRCSYKSVMERADAQKPIAELSQAERADLLTDSFVVKDSSVLDDAGEHGKEFKLVKWDHMGLPSFCNTELVVLHQTVTDLYNTSVDIDVRNFTFNSTDYTRDHTPEGTLSFDFCSRARDSLGGTGSDCVRPPPNCTRWPGCSNYSGSLACKGSPRPSLNNTFCEQRLTLHMRDKLTGNVSVQSLSTPTRQDFGRCVDGGNVTCTRTITVKYHTESWQYEAVPVYSKRICNRYKNDCSQCFCLDTIQHFWVVWLFDLQSGYSSLCSEQFSRVVREYTIFIGAAVSVTAVNLLLKFLLRAFSGFEKSHTRSEEEKSIALKIFVATFLNTAVVPLLVYAKISSLSETTCRDGSMGLFDPSDASTFGYDGMACEPSQTAEGKPVCSFGGGVCRAVLPDYFPVFAGEFTDFESLWYSTVSSSILITVMVNMVMTLQPLLVEYPVQFLRERVTPLISVTQRQLNAAFEGPDFELAARYGVVLNNIFSCMLYSAGSPVFYMVASMTCGLTYLVDKVALHWLYKTPTRYNDSLANVTTRLLPVAAILHIAFSIWKFSSVMPIVPVSEAITSSLTSTIAQGCESAISSNPTLCTWACSEKRELSCAYMLNSTLFVNHSLCADEAPGKCVGTVADTSFLNFNFQARLLTWGTFPSLIVLGLCFVFYAIRFLLLNPVLRPIFRQCCVLCCIPQNLMKTIGMDEDEDDGITYTAALSLGEHSPDQKLHADDRDDSPEHSREHVRWNGPFLFDITKISAYRDAFADMQMSRTAEDEAIVGDAENIWLSDAALTALRRRLANTVSPNVTVLSPAPTSRVQQPQQEEGEFAEPVLQDSHDPAPGESAAWSSAATAGWSTMDAEGIMEQNDDKNENVDRKSRNRQVASERRLRRMAQHSQKTEPPPAMASPSTLATPGLDDSADLIDSTEEINRTGTQVLEAVMTADCKESPPSAEARGGSGERDVLSGRVQKIAEGLNSEIDDGEVDGETLRTSKPAGMDSTMDQSILNDASFAGHTWTQDSESTLHSTSQFTAGDI